MKQLKVLCAILLLSHISKSQTVIPKPIPNVTQISGSVSSIENLIQAYEAIQTQGTVVFDTKDNMLIHPGEYISIDEKQLDVVWFYPNATPGIVGQFEKLELGVNFPQDISNEIQNFVDESSGNQLNPFNPEHINLYAEFWYLIDGHGWVGPIKSNGFYYKEFIRNTNDWTEEATDYHFRIRHAPRFTGTWRCKVSADVEGYGILTTNNFTFDCVHSESKDFMRVGDNKRYFRLGDEPFFPVGHNLSWPRFSDYSDWVMLYDIVPPKLYREYHQLLDTLKMNGANYFRFINAPWTTEIEFEKLGNYYDRMTHAWEMDKILEHADLLDLKMHYNMQIHHAFENPTIYAKKWDWPINTDPYADPSCMAPNDNGYCYRSELGITDPIDFFTNPEAIKHYKNRLRYMIARWGYSNEIAVMELMSEINNAGSTIEFTSTCNYLLNTASKPYVADAAVVCPKINAWQNEICRFIKEDLGHLDHPLAVSYTGQPNLQAGDSSFYSPYVDIATWNYYQLQVEKYAKGYRILGMDEGSSSYSSEYSLNKPIMHSEYGPGPGIKDCDNGTRMKKAITLTPFIGLAASAMYWDWQRGGETRYWGQMGIVNDFMEGIRLDEENWRPMPPLVTDDKEIEVIYLRNFEEDNYRACGVMSNRSYNYHTQGDGLPCRDTSVEVRRNDAYKVATSYSYSDFKNELKIPKMKASKEYRIEWFNAFTGEMVANQLVTSGVFGKLPINIPDNQILTGNEIQPILFFQIYRAEEPSFKTPVQTNGNNIGIYLNKLIPDTTISPIELTNWNSRRKDNIQTDEIMIAPNPTKDKIRVSVDADFVQDAAEWLLIDPTGNILKNGKVTDTNFMIDLSVYSIGAYYFIIENKNKRYVKKIIKQ